MKKVPAILKMQSERFMKYLFLLSSALEAQCPVWRLQRQKLTITCFVVNPAAIQIQTNKRGVAREEAKTN